VVLLKPKTRAGTKLGSDRPPIRTRLEPVRAGTQRAEHNNPIETLILVTNSQEHLDLIEESAIRDSHQKLMANALRRTPARPVDPFILLPDTLLLQVRSRRHPAMKLIRKHLYELLNYQRFLESLHFGSRFFFRTQHTHGGRDSSGACWINHRGMTLSGDFE
jgi:hypothetical protein